jgi:multiple sugar transport system substrate-binding protein
MKRRIFLLVVAVSLVIPGFLALAGGVQEKSGTGKVTLTFWNGFTASDGEVLREIVNKFNAENTANIEIKMDIMPWAVFYQKLPPALSTGTAPSFIIGGPADMMEYVPNGHFQPVGDFFSQTGVKESDFTPAVMELCKYDGKYYMLPMQTFYLILYWNKDLFKAAGLDPAKPPQTWSELSQFAVKLTDPAKAQYGFGIPVKTAPAYYMSLIWGNGGDLVDLKAKKSVLDSPENVKSFEFMRDLALNKKVTPLSVTGPDLDNLLISGKLAMYINGPWLINGLKTNNVNFGVAAPPKGSVSQNTPLDASTFAVLTKDPREKEAVYKFLKHWESLEVGKEWSLRNGFPPYLKSVFEDLAIKSDPTLSNQAVLGDIARRVLPNLAGSSRILDDVMFPLIEKVTTGADTPANAVKAASRQIDEILRQP